VIDGHNVELWAEDEIWLRSGFEESAKIRRRRIPIEREFGIRCTGVAEVSRLIHVSISRLRIAGPTRDEYT
jgi:hypothetical protein